MVCLQLYSQLMWLEMRFLPSWLAPTLDPVSMWTRKEVLARYRARSAADRRRRRAVRRVFHPAYKVGFFAFLLLNVTESDEANRFSFLVMQAAPASPFLIFRATSLSESASRWRSNGVKRTGSWERRTEERRKLKSLTCVDFVFKFCLKPFFWNIRALVSISHLHRRQF